MITRMSQPPLEVPEPQSKITAVVIDALLQRRYSDDQWRYLSQLRDGTGARQKRTIDAYALNIWPSEFQAIAFEIKVSRSDFFHEIKDPSKFQRWDDRCTAFFYVLPSGLVQKHEIPEGCGLMEAYGKKQLNLRIVQAPQIRKLDFMPVEFVMSLLARDKAPVSKHEPLYRVSGSEFTEDAFWKLVDQKVKDELAPQLEKALRKARVDVEGELNAKAQAGIDILNMVRQHFPGWGLDTAETAEKLKNEVNEALGTLKNVHRHVASLTAIARGLHDDGDRLNRIVDELKSVD